MFGPNVKSDVRENIYYHHREEKFHNILQRIDTLFHHIFGLDDYNILVINGSGTTANETVLYSCKFAFSCKFADDEFGMRLQRLSKAHGDKKQHPTKSCVAYPLYETSISRYNQSRCSRDTFVFLDMVSAFPYYMPPKGTAIWTTVSGKQLGAFPVLGIIGIRKDIDLHEFFITPNRSCLCLREHINFKYKSETLTTAALPLYYDLEQRLNIFNLQEYNLKINRRRKAIVDIAGEYVIGEGPVILFNQNTWIDNLAKRFNLYHSKVGYQIFLWSGSDEEYDCFCKVLKGYVK